MEGKICRFQQWQAATLDVLAATDAASEGAVTLNRRSSPDQRSSRTLKRRPWSIRLRTEAEIRVERKMQSCNRQNCLRGNMQIIVKTLTDETNTFDVEDQRHHRQCEDKKGMSDRTAVIDLRRKAARRRGKCCRTATSRRQDCVAEHLDEVQ